MLAEIDLSGLPGYQIRNIEEQFRSFSNIPCEDQRNKMQKGFEALLGLPKDELEQVVKIVELCRKLNCCQMKGLVKGIEDNI